MYRITGHGFRLCFTKYAIYHKKQIGLRVGVLPTCQAIVFERSLNNFPEMEI